MEIGGDLYADLSPAPGIRVISSRIEVDVRTDAHCVRFEIKQEETDNPLVPGQALMQHNTGVICRHPDDPRMLVIVTFTERYYSGQERPELRRQFAAQATSTLGSLEFTPL